MKPLGRVTSASLSSAVESPSGSSLCGTCRSTSSPEGASVAVVVGRAFRVGEKSKASHPVSGPVIACLTTKKFGCSQERTFSSESIGSQRVGSERKGRGVTDEGKPHSKKNLQRFGVCSSEAGTPQSSMNADGSGSPELMFGTVVRRP